MTASFRVGGVLIENGNEISGNNLPTASTSSPGVVQLSDSTSSSSTAVAATANAVSVSYTVAATAQTDAAQAIADAATAQAVADAALPASGGVLTGPVTFPGDQVIPTTNIDTASTSVPGIVQLNDTTTSTSTTEALTANQGKILQEQINALSASSNVVLAGTIDATTGNLASVTTEGTAAGFTVGNPLPSAVVGNDDYFVIVTFPGTMTPPGGSPQECHQGDWWLSDGSGWVFLDVGFNATAATTSTPGVVQLATDAEVQGGTNLDHAVTPAGLQSKVSDSTSTVSFTTLASSTAVKSAYDAGVQGQTDAAAALAAANTAGADVGTLASLTTTDKSSAVAAINEVNAATSAAQSDATQALGNAATAQGDATQALSNSASAQSDATQALSDAAAAQVDATQALADAAAAQGTADVALPLAGGVMTGDVTFAGSQTFSGTVGNLDFQAKGDLVSGFGVNSFGVTSVGTDGQTLTACSACASGLTWAAGGGGSLPATPTVAGLLPGCDNSTNGITAVGSNALLSLTTGTENIAIGLNAGCSLTTGFSNIAVGACALCSVIDTTENTAVGDLALWKTTGDSNTAVGSRAGRCVTTGNGNTAVGRSALEFNGVGSYNAGVGVSALRNACGNYNAALGYQAGFKSDCDYNVFVGSDSGRNLVTGTRNVFLGYNTGLSIVSGTDNILIGSSINPGVEVSGCLMIGVGSVVTWLTGGSSGAIKPGAGIIDCANSCGTSGQVLMSNGANAVCWGTAGGGGSSPATPTTAGVVLGCTTTTNTALGCNALLSTTGAGNTALGNNAGCSLTTETCNVIVGGYVGSVGESNAVSLSDGAGNLKLHVGQFGGWSVDGTTSGFGASGQVLTSNAGFGAPSWTTVPKYQTSTISTTTLGPGGASSLANGFGPSLNSWNYTNNIIVTVKAIDTVTSAQYNYLYNGTMYADGSTPWTMAQLAANVLDNTGGRLTFLLDYDTGYQYKARLTITYVSGNALSVSGNITWINLAGDFA